MFQRLDKLNKNAFASVGVFGKSRDAQIQGGTFHQAWSFYRGFKLDVTLLAPGSCSGRIRGFYYKTA